MFHCLDTASFPHHEQPQILNVASAFVASSVTPNPALLEALGVVSSPIVQVTNSRGALHAEWERSDRAGSSSPCYLTPSHLTSKVDNLFCILTSYGDKLASGAGACDVARCGGLGRRKSIPGSDTPTLPPARDFNASNVGTGTTNSGLLAGECKQACPASRSYLCG